MRRPPQELTEWLDRLDPARRVELISTNFIESSAVAGRAVVGARRAEWAAYEDKTRIDELFRRVGVATPAADVVPVRTGDLVPALRQVSGGQGCVCLD